MSQLKKTFRIALTLALMTAGAYAAAASSDDENPFSSTVHTPLISTHGSDLLEQPSADFTNAQRFLRDEHRLIQGKQLFLAGLAIFSANDMVGSCIRTVTWSDWSHAGILLKDNDGEFYCFESTGTPGQVLKGIRPQVQISKFEDTLKNYDGTVGVRHILTPDNATLPNVTDFVHHVLGRYYEEKFAQLFASLARLNGKADSSSYFCSEMLADLLIQLGYLPSGTGARLADNYLPHDFAADDLKLQGNIDVSDVILAKRVKVGCSRFFCC